MCHAQVYPKGYLRNVIPGCEAGLRRLCIFVMVACRSYECCTEWVTPDLPPREA